MFVTVRIAVQYVAMEDRVFDAFYKLQNPRSMMTSVVFDTVRSTLPKLTLDETFESKEELAHDTMRSLKSVMDKYGYLITNVMVTDVEPDSRVKQSMNEINAAKRMQDAAQYQADAMKIKVVKEAEADAESKYLAGTGIARQRKAIVDGLRQSIVSFSGEVADTTPREVIEMMLMTQYFDVLKCVLARATRARARAPSRTRPSADRACASRARPHDRTAPRSRATAGIWAGRTGRATPSSSTTRLAPSRKWATRSATPSCRRRP